MNVCNNTLLPSVARSNGLNHDKSNHNCETNRITVHLGRPVVVAPPYDLPALNIQRGRDHGLCGYKTMRECFGLAGVSNDFDTIPTTPERRRALSQLYDRPDDIDPWVGALVETHAPGAVVGPLVKAILVEQFDRLRHGDRFWFENDHALSVDEKAAIKRTKLADVLRRNATGDFPDDAFRVPQEQPPEPPAHVSESVFESTSTQAASPGTSDKHVDPGPSSKGTTFDRHGPLPPGWKVRFAEEEKKLIYYNREKRITQWVRPKFDPATSVSSAYDAVVPGAQVL